MRNIQARHAAVETVPGAVPLQPNQAARSLGARILTLLFLIRSTGNHLYRQELGIKEVELHLIGALGRLGPMTSLQLATATGVGKPQTSRTTTQLVARDILRRSHHRAPFELTPSGKRIFRRMSDLSAQRQAQIMTGLDDEAQQFLSAMIAKLLRTGEEWLVEERRLSTGANEETLISGASGDIADADALIPSLVTMSILMQRSAFLLWRRTVGISPFNWVVLSRVAEAGRIRFHRLVHLTARDKSQVWRTVSQLIEEDLLIRHSEPGRREIELTVTPEGERIYQATAQYSLERDAMIAEVLGRENWLRFRNLVEVMITNTRQLMHRDTTGA